MLRKSTSLILKLVLFASFLWSQSVLASDCRGTSPSAVVATYFPEGDGFWVFGNNNPNGAALSVCSTGGELISVVFKSKDSASEFADLNILSIQSFNGLLVVTQETGAAYLIRIFAYDSKLNNIKEMASDGSKFLPELVYAGAELQPAVGLIHSELNSIVSSKPRPTEELLYFLDRKKGVVLSKRRAWNPRRLF